MFNRFSSLVYILSLVRASSRESDFRICEKVRLKPAWSATKANKSLESFNLASIVLYYLGSELKSDQTARMRMLICAFVVHIGHKAGVLMTRLLYLIVPLYFLFLWDSST